MRGKVLALVRATYSRQAQTPARTYGQGTGLEWGRGVRPRAQRADDARRLNAVQWHALSPGRGLFLQRGQGPTHKGPFLASGKYVAATSKLHIHKAKVFQGLCGLIIQE